jgi:hypothetical protein
MINPSGHGAHLQDAIKNQWSGDPMDFRASLLSLLANKAKALVQKQGSGEAGQAYDDAKKRV